MWCPMMRDRPEIVQVSCADDRWSLIFMIFGVGNVHGISIPACVQFKGGRVVLGRICGRFICRAGNTPV